MTQSRPLSATLASPLAQFLAGARGGLFPSDIQGLQLWLDAADTGTIQESSGSVSQWDDKSGNGNNATQGTGAQQPTTNTTTENGKNVIDFDGGDLMDLPSTIYPIANGDNTCFIVSKTDNNGSTQTIVSLSEAGSTRYDVQYDFTDSEINFQSRNAFGGAVTDVGIIKTDYNIIRARREGVTQALSYNGNAESTNSNGVDESGIDAAAIGAFTSGSLRQLDGKIAEILIYNRSLSASEIAIIEGYLSNKWGIVI